MLGTVAKLTDEDVLSPTRLPEWTVGHVLTHLARNADGHTRRLEAALRGEDVARYPGGRADGTRTSPAARPARHAKSSTT